MKTVVVTGASRGIGKATSLKFLEDGWRVIGTSTSGKVDISSPNFTCIQLDYSNKEQIESVAKAIIEKFKTIDCLVNNAAIFIDHVGERVDLDILKRTLDVNLIGTITFTEHIIDGMVSGGHIINVSSMGASLTDDIAQEWVSPSYQISKAGLNMYTRVLSALLSTTNITVSSLDPGWVKTDMGGDEADRAPEDAARDILILSKSKVEGGYFWLEGEKRDW